MDDTDCRVYSILHDAVREAYGTAAPDDEHPDAEACLDCDHALGAHHGPDGERRCGESGCGCKAGRYASRLHYSADDDLVGTPDHNRKV